MNGEFRDGVFVLSGNLDETFGPQDLDRALAVGPKPGPGERLRLDLSEVKHANSLGVCKWVAVTRALGYGITYVRVPVWMVEQFCFVADLLEGDVQVESFFAPFFEVGTDHSFPALLRVGEDVPVLESYEGFEFFEKNGDRKRLEPDFDPENYLSFLSFLRVREKT